jgi:2,4-dienoyl-CoA reductase-like NADH-dependent reductase (Old Yellow Enzyme family)
MTMAHAAAGVFTPLALPNGVTLRNRLVKAAMSDSLGDGRGNPTPEQIRLYERWAEGRVGASIIGEVQGDPRFPEKPGNLVLADGCDRDAFRRLAVRGARGGGQIWVQLGHAGALAYAPIGTPKGPSALDLPGLKADALTAAEVRALPDQFARTARMAQDLGFGGAEIHAAHGFLLSQFLSPLFNRRTDAYGGSISGRMRLLLETLRAVRAAVAQDFVVALKLNATDQLSGGLTETDALKVVSALGGTGLDLLDISGGTYFPGAPSSSDRASSGPYFLDFAAQARRRTDVPLMVTGGFKRRADAENAIRSGAVDAVGLARALVLDPCLPKTWAAGGEDPVFPRFETPPSGGLTAWYTMRLTDLGRDRDRQSGRDLATAIAHYEARVAEKAELWNRRFGLCP